MKKKLKNISKITLGSYETPMAVGEVACLQGGQFDELGRLNRPPDTFIDLSDKSKKHLLQKGDVLLAGKGFRNFAWHYGGEYAPTVASSIFFILRPNPAVLLPEYLTIFLNLPASRGWLGAQGAGSNIPSIRKSTLQQMEINLPPLGMQQKIIELNAIHQQEVILMEKIMEKKTLLFESALHQTINHKKNKGSRHKQPPEKSLTSYRNGTKEEINSI